MKNIKQYIELSKANFEIKSFPNEELDVLGEAIEFIQGGIDEITLFVKICISFSEYKRANRFISENIYNDGITKEDIEKSMEYVIEVLDIPYQEG